MLAPEAARHAGRVTCRGGHALLAPVALLARPRPSRACRAARATPHAPHRLQRTSRGCCTCSAARETAYWVRRWTPPQEDLGVLVSHGDVQNGDSVELGGRSFVVSRVSTHFRLERGKYRKEGSRLHVVETSRWLLDGYLTQLYEKP